MIRIVSPRSVWATTRSRARGVAMEMRGRGELANQAPRVLGPVRTVVGELGRVRPVPGVGDPMLRPRVRPCVTGSVLTHVWWVGARGCYIREREPRGLTCSDGP